MWGLSVVIDVVVNIVMLYSMFYYILYFKMKPVRYGVIAVLISEIIVCCSYAIFGNMVIAWVISLVVPPIAVMLLTERKRWSILIYSFLGIIIIGSIEGMFKHIVGMMLVLLNVGYSKYALVVAGEVSTFILWFFICFKLHGYYVNRKNTISPKFFAFLGFSIVLNMQIYVRAIDCINAIGYETLGYTNVKTASFLLILCGIALLFEWVYILFLYFERTKLNITNDTFRSYMEMERRHFEDVKIKDEKMRRFRHDIKGHIVALKQYIDNNEIETAAEYITRMDEEFSNAKMKYNTGTLIVDGILNQKNYIAEKDNIKFDIQGDFTKLNTLDDFAVCTIFQNALQNAIEACRKINDDAEKVIKVKCDLMGNEIFLIFSNPVAQPLKIKNNIIKTSKSDYVNHGFGLRQIDKVVSDLGGKMFLSCENMEFNLKINI